SFDDEAVSLGRVLPPNGLLATHDRADAVHLTWFASAIEGEVHAYEVVALYEATRSAPSSPATEGMRAPRISGYVIARDESELARVAATATSYDDTTASLPVAAAPGQFEVSQGTRTDGVELTWVAPDEKPGTAHSYGIVTLFEGGQTESSATVTGQR